jgi:hypothetical protein
MYGTDRTERTCVLRSQIRYKGMAGTGRMVCAQTHSGTAIPYGEV